MAGKQQQGFVNFMYSTLLKPLVERMSTMMVLL
jgi:hypothetical protein